MQLKGFRAGKSPRKHIQSEKMEAVPGSQESFLKPKRSFARMGTTQTVQWDQGGQSSSFVASRLQQEQQRTGSFLCSFLQGEPFLSHRPCLLQHFLLLEPAPSKVGQQSSLRCRNGVIGTAAVGHQCRSEGRCPLPPLVCFRSLLGPLGDQDEAESSTGSFRGRRRCGSFPGPFKSEWSLRD